MISSLALRTTRDGSVSETVFAPGNITVIVGPNNAGKSLLLREINEKVGNPAISGKILVDCKIGPTSVLSLRRMFPPPGSDTPVTFRNFTTGGGSGINPESLRRLHSEEQPNFTEFEAALRHIGRVFIAGPDRYRLIQTQPIGTFKQPPSNPFQYLLTQVSLRRRLSSMFEEAFHRHLLIDPTEGHLQLVTSDVDLPDHSLEYSFGPTAVEFFKNCSPLDQMSDGVKAYTSLLIAVLTSFRQLFLIDEPEAFLHPVLVNRLGRHLATLAAEQGGTVIAATHSAEFLFGAIQAGCPVSVVRLTYDGQAGTSRVLDHNEIRTLMRDPLLRSTGTLAALFYEGAIVCEGDSDRVFYQEIHERLSKADGSGSGNSIFLQGYGWQRIARIVRPLRNLGIPAAAIVDLDTLFKEEFADLMSACSVPEASIKGFGQIRGEIKGQIKRQGVDYKTLGISCIGSGSREAAEQLLGNLREYGIFVVPVGEVECWLRGLNVRVNKADWAAAMLDRLGADDAPGTEAQPGSGDVWAFVRSVAQWLRARHRKGMPA
jgi:energy-coupling factor transporter ATP-binding protein EcfA2